jgi:hypothetical protein
MGLIQLMRMDSKTTVSQCTKTADTYLFRSFCVTCEVLAKINSSAENAARKHAARQAAVMPSQFVVAQRSGESLYPYFRLLVSLLDRARKNFGLQQKKLAEVYATVYGLTKGSPDYQRLVQYTDPSTAAGSSKTHGSKDSTGDFSRVLFEIVRARTQEDRWEVLPGGERVEKKSTWTLKDINDVRCAACMASMGW